MKYLLPELRSGQYMLVCNSKWLIIVMISIQSGLHILKESVLEAQEVDDKLHWNRLRNYMGRYNMCVCVCGCVKSIIIFFHSLFSLSFCLLSSSCLGLSFSSPSPLLFLFHLDTRACSWRIQKTSDMEWVPAEATRLLTTESFKETFGREQAIDTRCTKSWPQ